VWVQSSVRDEKLKVRLLSDEIFSAVQEHRPPENYSPIAIRCHFWIVRNLAFPFSLVLCSLSLVPFKKAKQI